MLTGNDKTISCENQTDEWSLINSHVGKKRENIKILKCSIRVRSFLQVASLSTIHRD